MAQARLHRWSALVFAGFVLLAIGVTNGSAQELYGSVLGTVRDASGGHIPGATIARVGEGIAVTFESGLLYDLNSDRIKEQAAQNLRTLVASLDKYPNTDLLIVGHTDAVGTGEYNQGLSQRRATAASNYLASQGVSAARLRALGRGEGIACHATALLESS